MLQKMPSEHPSGHTTLAPFLRQQGRALDSVLGDGNCLFRAISKHLTGVEHQHLLLRKTIAHFEAANQAVFSSLHTAINQTEFTEHLKNMKMPYVWGTSVEIMAAASLFQLDFYVATDSYKPGVPTWLLYTPKPLSVLSNRTVPNQLRDQKKGWVELAFVRQCHFDNVKTLEGSQVTRPELEGNHSQLVIL